MSMDLMLEVNNKDGYKVEVAYFSDSGATKEIAENIGQDIWAFSGLGVGQLYSLVGSVDADVLSEYAAQQLAEIKTACVENPLAVAQII